MDVLESLNWSQFLDVTLMILKNQNNPLFVREYSFECKKKNYFLFLLFFFFSDVRKHKTYFAYTDSMEVMVKKIYFFIV